MTLSFVASQHICTVYREMPGRAPACFIVTLSGTYLRRSDRFSAFFLGRRGAPDAVFSGTICPFTDISVSKETPASAHILHAELPSPAPDPFLLELEAARNICSPGRAKSPSKFRRRCLCKIKHGTMWHPQKAHLFTCVLWLCPRISSLAKKAGRPAIKTLWFIRSVPLLGYNVGILCQSPLQEAAFFWQPLREEFKYIQYILPPSPGPTPGHVERWVGYI